MRRGQILDAVTFFCLLVAIILSFTAYRNESANHQQEILSNRERITEDGAVARKACTDVHRLDAVLEVFIDQTAKQQPLRFPGLTNVQYVILARSQEDSVSRDLMLLGHLRAADCKTPR